VIPNAIPFVTAVTTSASRTTPSSSFPSRSPGETRRKIARHGSSRKREREHGRDQAERR
jgi:hypothetical protein